MSKQGFSLVEIVVVIFIIVILLAIALPSFYNQTIKSRESEPLQNVSTILTSQQEYYLQHSEFAASLELLTLALPEKTSSYTYQIFSIDEASVIIANSQNKELHSYLGAIKIAPKGEGEFVTVRCVSNKLGVKLDTDNLQIKKNRLGCGKQIKKVS